MFKDDSVGTPEKRAAVREMMASPVICRYDIEGSYGEIHRALPARTPRWTQLPRIGSTVMATREGFITV